MSSDVQEIEQAIRTLPRRDIEQLREWIEDFLEDQLELTDEFKARIEQANRISEKAPCGSAKRSRTQRESSDGDLLA